VIGDGEVAVLAAIATEVAAYIAPLALLHGKTVAVTGSRRSVPVRGNADTLGRAVRAHTAPRGAVEISVGAIGTLSMNGSWLRCTDYRTGADLSAFLAP